MRIYISTTSRRIERTKGFATEASFTETQLGERAVADITGALTCDALILVMLAEMKGAMTGAAIEIGAALAAGNHVVVVEEECAFDHFFSHHPLVSKVRTFNDALAELVL